MKSLYSFFKQFSKSYYYLLFLFSAEIFNCTYVIRKFQKKINILVYKKTYIGHFFEKRAVISAKLTGLLGKEIQIFER